LAVHVDFLAFHPLGMGLKKAEKSSGFKFTKVELKQIYKNTLKQYS
jgi:hypothetical protein